MRSRHRDAGTGSARGILQKSAFSSFKTGGLLVSNEFMNSINGRRPASMACFSISTPLTPSWMSIFRNNRLGSPIITSRN